MKAEELRIGNLLQKLDGSVFKVVTDDIWKIQTWTASERLLPKGIPISEGKLLEAGFAPDEEWEHGEYLRSCYKFQIYDFYCAIITDGKDFYFAVDGELGYEKLGRKIEFIHQLQNLYFDLTGEEIVFK